MRLAQCAAEAIEKDEPAEKTSGRAEGGDPSGARRSAPNEAATAVRESAAAAQALADRLVGRTKAAAAAVKAPGAGKPSRAAEPELAVGPEHAERAGELARRERRIKEGLQALLGERAGPQESIRKEAVALGQELIDLSDRVRGLSDRASYPAWEAGNHVGNHAPSAINQGVEHLAGGQAHAARDDERRAASLLGRGAELAEDAAAALRAEMRDGQAAAAQDGAGGGKDAGEALGDARDQMRKAGQELDEARDPARADEAGLEARQAMLRAWRDLQAAAELTGMEPAPTLAGLDDSGGLEHPADDDDEGLPHSPAAGETRDPKTQPGGKGEADLTELKALVREKTGRSWGELPGHLRNEILQMQAGRYRDDYARIIQLYFREIAAEAGSRRECEAMKREMRGRFEKIGGLRLGLRACRARCGSFARGRRGEDGIRESGRAPGG